MAESQAPVRNPGLLSGDLQKWLAATRWPLGLAVVLVVFGLAAPFWNVPLNRDQGVYATCASILLNGGIPYRDCWDTKGPALHYTYATAEILFNHNTAGPYILNAAAIAATALVIAAIARRWFARLEWAYAIGLLYGLLAISVRFDMNAQPESFANLFAMLGLLAITLGIRKNDRIMYFLGGVALACAVLYKYALVLPYGAAALSLIALHPSPGKAWDRWKALGWITAGSLAVVLFSAAYLVIVGALDDALLHLRFILFYFPNAQLNPDEYALRSLPVEQTLLYFGRLPAIFGLAFLGSIAAMLNRRWYGWQIAAFSIAGIAVVWGQQRFTPYHWTVCLPALVLGIGALIQEIEGAARIDGRVKSVLAVIIAAAVLLNTAYFFYQDQWLIMGKYITGAETRQQFFETHGTWDHAVAAEYIRARTEQDDRIWVWGHHTAIYYLADRLPPTRFIYNEPLLMHIRGGHPWREAWRAEALDDIYAEPPAYLLLTTFDRTFFDFQNPNVAWESIPEYNAFTTTHYLKEYEFGRFQFYRLIPYWSRQNNPELLQAVTLIDLIEELPQASIDVQADPPIEVIDYPIMPEPAYRTIRIAPPGRLTFTVEVPPAPVCLRFDTAMYPDSWAWGGDGASFTVQAAIGGESTVIFEQYVSNAPDDQHWHAHLIDLSAYAGKTAQITLETGPGPNGDFVGDWAGWGMPRIVQPPSGDICDSNVIVDTRP